MRTNGVTRWIAAIALAAGLLAVPAAASAITVEQIVALSKAGVTDAVILALLERDRTILSIEPEQVVALKRDGLSDAVILAMLKNGRAEGEAAARAQSEEKAASILSNLTISSLTPGPDLVIVGHGPDRPNTDYGTNLFSVSAGYTPRHGGGYAAVPYALPPYSIPSGPYGSAKYGRDYDRTHETRGDRVLCVAQVNTNRGPGPSYITECPAVMQRALRAR